MSDNLAGRVPPDLSGSPVRAPEQAVPAGTALQLDDYRICDSLFMEDVKQLKALRSYMIRQAKSAEAWRIELGDLNLLHLDQKGRYPTYDEWQNLEHQSNELYRHLSEADRRRFLYGQIPSFVIITAVVLGVVALVSVVIAFWAALIVIGPTATSTSEAPTASQLAAVARASTLFSLTMLVSFPAWVAALGDVGSIAFIGMNALAVQEDATFDITNKTLIGLRVVLGAARQTTVGRPRPRISGASKQSR